jgi:predicted O-linked N-acetylglucosamine transferase (SPINDLY family)
MTDDGRDVIPPLKRGFDLHRAGRLAEAEALYREVLSTQPDHADALHLLGVIEGGKGRVREALALLERAAALAPAAPHVFCNLAKFLVDAGRAEDAESAARHAVASRPDYAEAHSNLAAALNARSRWEEAAAAARAAIALAPALAPAHHNLGNAQRGLGRVDLAIEAYRSALRLRPRAVEVHHELLNSIRYDPSFDAAAILRPTARWYREHAASLARASRPHANVRDAERRMRVGYVSPDLREHPVGLNLLPLFRSHSHEAVEVFTYSGAGRADRLTAEFQALSDAWRPSVGLSHAQLADVIRRDAIDILVDLSLHGAGNRLLTFALKPAPIQVTFAGYPGTTGMDVIDYRLTDPHLDPPGETDHCYAETSVRLPDTFWCIDPMADDVPVGALPASGSGTVTFGCLNDACKVNEAVLARWARVLQAVPGSCLVVGCPGVSPRRRVLDLLASGGVTAERVAFRERLPRREYLLLYREIDVALDTLPYNGHTTSLDAFWMGVPVVTLAGETVVGRAGLSMATNLGATELVARTADQFVEIARGLALDLPRLAALRATLRDRMRRSPLMDGRAFARNVEAAYREMWRRWCGEAGSRASTQGRADGDDARSRP